MTFDAFYLNILLTIGNIGVILAYRIPFETSVPTLDKSSFFLFFPLFFLFLAIYFAQLKIAALRLASLALAPQKSRQKSCLGGRFNFHGSHDENKKYVGEKSVF